MAHWFCPGCSNIETGKPSGTVSGGEYEGTVGLCEHCWSAHEEGDCGCEECSCSEEE